MSVMTPSQGHRTPVFRRRVERVVECACGNTAVYSIISSENTNQLPQDITPARAPPGLASTSVGLYSFTSRRRRWVRVCCTCLCAHAVRSIESLLHFYFLCVRLRAGILQRLHWCRRSVLHRRIRYHRSLMERGFAVRRHICTCTWTAYITPTAAHNASNGLVLDLNNSGRDITLLLPTEELGMPTRLTHIRSPTASPIGPSFWWDSGPSRRSFAHRLARTPHRSVQPLGGILVSGVGRRVRIYCTATSSLGLSANMLADVPLFRAQWT
ncbi:hypothetical protein BV20DRAFT_734730 [Pilatotrama ljubarskyi]|nr:hypothetical protein BV20DRAFT_734730 [Pilatotrama ljubarskyi]